jgi:hypothetical protein
MLRIWRESEFNSDNAGPVGIGPEGKYQLEQLARSIQTNAILENIGGERRAVPVFLLRDWPRWGQSLVRGGEEKNRLVKACSKQNSADKPSPVKNCFAVL